MARVVSGHQACNRRTWRYSPSRRWGRSCITSLTAGFLSGVDPDNCYVRDMTWTNPCSSLLVQHTSAPAAFHPANKAGAACMLMLPDPSIVQAKRNGLPQSILSGNAPTLKLCHLKSVLQGNPHAFNMRSGMSTGQPEYEGKKCVNNTEYTGRAPWRLLCLPGKPSAPTSASNSACAPASQESHTQYLDRKWRVEQVPHDNETIF